jgi:hypothetical protein
MNPARLYGVNAIARALTSIVAQCKMLQLKAE